MHRDLKPGNIFLCEDGVAKVLDFGMSKLATAESLTQAGYTLGTPEYMAPEQCIGAQVEPRTDIYALGVMMYEALTGELPIVAQNRRELLDLHQRQIPTPMRQRRPDLPIPEALDLAVMKCLKKRVNERPKSAARARAACSSAVPLEGLPKSYPPGTSRRAPGSRSGATHAAPHEASIEPQRDVERQEPRAPRRHRPDEVREAEREHAERAAITTVLRESAGRGASRAPPAAASDLPARCPPATGARPERRAASSRVSGSRAGKRLVRGALDSREGVADRLLEREHRAPDAEHDAPAARAPRGRRDRRDSPSHVPFFAARSRTETAPPRTDDPTCSRDAVRVGEGQVALGCAPNHVRAPLLREREHGPLVAPLDDADPGRAVRAHRGHRLRRPARARGRASPPRGRA